MEQSVGSAALLEFLTGTARARVVATHFGVASTKRQRLIIVRSNDVPDTRLNCLRAQGLEIGIQGLYCGWNGFVCFLNRVLLVGALGKNFPTLFGS